MLGEKKPQENKVTYPRTYIKAKFELEPTCLDS